MAGHQVHAHLLKLKAEGKVTGSRRQVGLDPGLTPRWQPRPRAVVACARRQTKRGGPAVADTQLFINGEWTDAEVGRDVPDLRTVHRREDRRRRQGRPRRRAARRSRPRARRSTTARGRRCRARSAPRSCARSPSSSPRAQRRDRRDRSARRRRHDQEGDVRRRARRRVARSSTSPTAPRTSPT